MPAPIRLNRSQHYGNAYGGIPGGCWEEGYYNCVRAWSECKMPDTVYEAVRRRGETYARDGDCVEWYTRAKGLAQGRDRYGISACAHVAAVIEGLFGVTPVGGGFDEINIHPNLSAKWAGRTASLRVTLPRNGFLEYSHTYDAANKAVTVTTLSDKRRVGHFRVFAPMPVVNVKWNSEETRYDSATRRWRILRLSGQAVSAGPSRGQHGNSSVMAAGTGRAVIRCEAQRSLAGLKVPIRPTMIKKLIQFLVWDRQLIRTQ